MADVSAAREVDLVGCLLWAALVTAERCRAAGMTAPDTVVEAAANVGVLLECRAEVEPVSRTRVGGSEAAIVPVILVQAGGEWTLPGPDGILGRVTGPVALDADGWVECLDNRPDARDLDSEQLVADLLDVEELPAVISMTEFTPTHHRLTVQRCRPQDAAKHRSRWPHAYADHSCLPGRRLRVGRSWWEARRRPVPAAAVPPVRTGA